MKVLLQCQDDEFWESDGLVKGVGRVQVYSNFSRFGGGRFSLSNYHLGYPVCRL